MVEPTEDDLFDKLRVELRRGALTLAVMTALREERYGYTLTHPHVGTGQWVRF